MNSVPRGHATAMTIAGSDPSGGAGLQADIKTFHQHGVYATSVVTLLTVQNTLGVTAVQAIDRDLVLDQLDAVLDDLPPKAAKTGALGNGQLIAAVASRAAEFAFPLVVDPVMVSKHGHSLIDDSAVQQLVENLLPQAYLITPNCLEAQRLTGITIQSRQQMADAAGQIAQLGIRRVLVKGGAFDGQAVDLLWIDGEHHWLVAPRCETSSLHGTGCVFSAAITARLALGQDLLMAAQGAKRFVTQAITDAPPLGHGVGPIQMMTTAFPPDAP